MVRVKIGFRLCSNSMQCVRRVLPLFAFIFDRNLLIFQNPLFFTNYFRIFAKNLFAYVSKNEKES